MLPLYDQFSAHQNHQSITLGATFGVVDSTFIADIQIARQTDQPQGFIFL